MSEGFEAKSRRDVRDTPGLASVVRVVESAALLLGTLFVLPAAVIRFCAGKGTFGRVVLCVLVGGIGFAAIGYPMSELFSLHRFPFAEVGLGVLGAALFAFFQWKYGWQKAARLTEPDLWHASARVFVRCLKLFVMFVVTSILMWEILTRTIGFDRDMAEGIPILATGAYFLFSLTRFASKKAEPHGETAVKP